MHLLAIDTAHRFCSAAILSTGTGAAERLVAERLEIGRGHAEKLFSTIDAVLGDAGLRTGDLDRVAVNVGPGSFTGLRVGVAAARGLALALECPCIGVSAFEALAMQCPATDRPRILALLDAGRGKVMAQSFDGATRQALGPCRSLDPGDAATLWRQTAALAVGTGVRACIAAQPDAAACPSAGPEWPDIACFARLAADRAPGASPVPWYGRAADATPSAPALLVQR